MFLITLPVLQQTGRGLIWWINGGDKKKSCTFIAFFESKNHCLTLPNNRIHGSLRRMGALLVMIILTGAGSCPLVAQQNFADHAIHVLEHGVQSCLCRQQWRNLCHGAGSAAMDRFQRSRRVENCSPTLYADRGCPH